MVVELSENSRLYYKDWLDDFLSEIEMFCKKW